MVVQLLSRLTFLKVEECHAEDGSEVRPGEEERSHEGDGLHGCAVSFTGVCDAALFSGNFEVEPCFALRHDVV